MKKIYTSAFCLLIALEAFAQNNTNLSGRILDKETEMPIPFSHIFLKKGSGTSSNQLGYFSFTSPVKPDTIIISCIGYKTEKIAYKDFQNDKIIYLQPFSEQLKEAVVFAISPVQILKKAEKMMRRSFAHYFFSATYSLDQFIYNSDTDDLVAYGTMSGLLNDNPQDTLRTYPKFQLKNASLSGNFLKYDTVKGMFGVSNSVKPDLMYFFDPLVSSLKKRFSVFPAIFSNNMYKAENITIQGVIEIDGEKHYQIYVSNSKESLAAYFLVNSKDFGVKNLTIKINAMDKGKMLRNHISASYQKVNKKYYLENLDLFIRRTTDPVELFYYSSLHFSNFKTRGMERINRGSENNLNLKKFAGITMLNDTVNFTQNWKLLQNGKFLKPIKESF